MCSLVLDLVSLLFYIINIYGGLFIILTKFYVLLIALPFVYRAATCWSDPDCDDDRKTNSFRIQIMAMIVGLCVGGAAAYNQQWMAITALPGIFTSVSDFFILGIPKFFG